uniref:zeta toxin family protein n=1 Tax=Comamonas testosteroni TaxID=285 RepID=UPI0015F8E808|nr:zeta toxin family protein [Comamonas testosteroni]
MTEQEQQFIEEAKAWVKAHRTELSRSITDTARYPREDAPVSVFMAGSPGAGKTETSKAYIEQFSEETQEVLRIDPDEYRELIPGYTGANSWLVQPAVSLLVERVLDRALTQKQSFILDGTFSNLSKSIDNIRRSLDRGRFVQILYV